MKEITITAIENEQIKRLFNLFFENLQRALDIKDKNRKKRFFTFLPTDKLLRNIIKYRETLKFQDFDSLIRNLQALEKNQAYMETTEWKLLTLSSPVLMDSQNPVLIFQTLEYFSGIGFLAEDNFSVINVASILYSLSESDPLNTAKMLTRLQCFKLLTEQNLGKMRTNPQEESAQYYSSIIHKLSLTAESEDTNLLTQVNLDRLLKSPKFNLNILSKFIQTEDKLKPTTQERLDLAFALDSLLTQENIDKIEKSEFDTKILTGIIFLLGKANILNQDNFNFIISIEEEHRIMFLQVLTKLEDSNILEQKEFEDLVKTYHKNNHFDQENSLPKDSTDGSFNSFSLVDKLFATFLKIKTLTKVIFDKIINFFNHKVDLHNATQQEETKAGSVNVAQNSNSFFSNLTKNTEELVTSHAPTISVCS